MSTAQQSARSVLFRVEELQAIADVFFDVAAGHADHEGVRRGLAAASALLKGRLEREDDSRRAALDRVDMTTLTQRARPWSALTGDEPFLRTDKNAVVALPWMQVVTLVLTSGAMTGRQQLPPHILADVEKGWRLLDAAVQTPAPAPQVAASTRSVSVAPAIAARPAGRVGRMAQAARRLLAGSAHRPRRDGHPPPRR